MSKVLIGVKGRAVRAALNPKKPATIACYILDVPGLAPGWDQYFLSIVHLRDEPGLPEAVRVYSTDASHQFLFAAIDERSSGGKAEAHRLDRVKLLKPITFNIEIGPITDEQAADFALKMTKAVLEGTLHPEPAFTPDHTGMFNKWNEYMHKLISGYQGKEASGGFAVVESETGIVRDLTLKGDSKLAIRKDGGAIH